MVCSDKEARKRLTESSGTPAIDLEGLYFIYIIIIFFMFCVSLFRVLIYFKEVLFWFVSLLCRHTASNSITIEMHASGV